MYFRAVKDVTMEMLYHKIVFSATQDLFHTIYALSNFWCYMYVGNDFKDRECWGGGEGGKKRRQYCIVELFLSVLMFIIFVVDSGITKISIQLFTYMCSAKRTWHGYLAQHSFKLRKSRADLM